MMSADYTLFYNPDDGKLHAGSCHEEKEVLQDVNVSGIADIDGYEGEGNILRLKGLKFETTADIALVVPDGTVIDLSEGENIIKVLAQGPEANVAALYCKGNLEITGGDGSLFCDSTSTTKDNCLWSRGICVRYGNLTISGGSVKSLCGPCSRNGGAVYAGGRLFGGENENGAITITGGRVEAASVPHTIRATNTKLTIGAGSSVQNSNEFSGSAQEWHGDFLAQADTEKPVIIEFE